MPAAKATSRNARTIRAMLLIALLGGALAIYNVVTVANDVALATGPKSDNQRAFFVRAAERPDLELFYKSLRPAERIKFAENLAKYDEPKLAPVIAKLLGTFDPAARQVLQRSLIALAKREPDAVADQLATGGSFQQLAVSEALKSLGPDAIPRVVKRLSDAGMRANAVAYLVDAGEIAVPDLLQQLASESADVRIAAADALGKLAAEAAAEPLAKLYAASKPPERDAYLSSIASIGAAGSFEILRAAFLDAELTPAQRAQAGLGLGRTKRPEAVPVLNRYSQDADLQLRESALGGLALVGDAALASSELSDPLRLEIAGRVSSPLADSILRKAFLDPKYVLRAAALSADRPSLTRELVATVIRAENDEIADIAIRSLATTANGQSELAKLRTNDRLAGLIVRRLPTP